MNTATSVLCSKNNDCGNSGTYSANRSSTYKYVNGQFNVSYSDGTGANGDYATDTFTIGGQSVQDLPFGIGYNSTSNDAVLGLGYAVDKVPLGRFSLAPYSSLPQRLVKEGKINSNAYSLWLNDQGASAGSILFGGVDTAKYAGALQTISVIPNNGVYRDFNVALTAVGQNGTYDLPQGSNIITHLNPGGPWSYLPDNITTILYRQLDVEYNSNSGEAVVDCNIASRPGTIDFSFSGANISIPLKTFVVPWTTADGRSACVFGILPSSLIGYVTLGISFLRAVYVVYDLDNNQISLAPTKYNITEENIVEIARGPNGVPTSVFNTPTSSPTSGGSTPTNSFSTSGTGGDGGDSSKGLSTGAKAGIGMGAIAGAALIFGAALLLIKRRRGTDAQLDTMKPPTARTGGQLPEYMGRA